MRLDCSKGILRGPSSEVKSLSSFRNENSTFSFSIVIINTHRVCRILSFYKSENSGQLEPTFYGREGGVYEGVNWAARIHLSIITWQPCLLIEKCFSSDEYTINRKHGYSQLKQRITAFSQIS